MAFDGVFAFQGKDHITASQLGRIVEGVAGKGRYVLPTLNQMTAEMQTANKVRVGTGDLVMDGRVVTNEAAVDLTVESGTSGYKRNDLVVCRYTKNASTGVENFAAEVVKGTPTTGTAADPEVTEGDISTGSASAVMPLWRIPLDGITPGAPVRIAPVASTLKTLGDSVSQSKPVVLFDNWSNPMNAGVRLTEPINNFSRVTFSFRTNDGFLAPDVTVFYPRGDITNIVANAIYSRPNGNLYIKTKGFTVRGTSVETSRDGQAYSIAEHNLTTGETKHIDVITVVRVMGWR